jgi:hypothetical protein
MGRQKIWMSDELRTSDDSVRLTNRLTSVFKGYFPQVLEWFRDKDPLVFCDFLMH